MAITLTPEQLAAMNPCGVEDRLALFGRRKKMDVRQALKAGATVRDILWVAGRLGHRRRQTGRNRGATRSARGDFRMTHKPWPAVPGTAERAPLVEIVIFVTVCIGLLAGAVVTVCGFLVGLAGVLS